MDTRTKTRKRTAPTKKGVIIVGGKWVDMERILVPRKNKRVKDFIKELEPNFERIMLHARRNNEQAFKSEEHLKKWLVGNQEDYPQFNYDIYFYFLNKSGIPLK